MNKLFIVLTVFLLCLCICPPASAQWGTITGRVLEGNRPLPGLIVELHGSCQGAFSDSTGSFSFSNVRFGNYEVRVRRPLDRRAFVTPVELSQTGSSELRIILRREICDPLAAELDIEAGSPRLLIVQGIDGSSNTWLDNAFEKEYKVKYELYGCTGPPDGCVRAYNQVVIEYLDKKYGSEWRDQVRPDFRTHYLQ
jgi:hypothetical protein